MSWNVQAIDKEKIVNELEKQKTFTHNEGAISTLDAIILLVKSFPVPEGSVLIAELYGHTDGYACNCDVKLKTFRT